MTTELEEQFFKVFGVEPKMLCNCEFKNLYDYRIEYGSDVCDYTESKIKEPCKVCKKAKQKVPLYPEITDHKLLELICILNKEAIYGYSDWGGNFVIGETAEELKESILTDCIRNKSKIFKQIQQSFKEGE